MQSVSGRSPSSPIGYALDGDADAEVAKVLVAVGLQRRFAEDLPQDLAGDLVPFPWLGFQIAPPFGFPVLLLGGLELPAFLGVADELGVLQLLDRRLHLGQRGGLADLIDKEGGDVGLGARQVTDELQEADDLGDPQAPSRGPRGRP